MMVWKRRDFLKTHPIAANMFLIALASPLLGEIIRVPDDAPTIQIAIEKSEPFDLVIVSPGTYFEAINFGGRSITVQSTNPNDPQVVASTIINAGGLGNVVTFTGGEDATNTVLRGFTVTGGTIGIHAHGSRSLIQRCRIIENTSSGIRESSGRIEDCTIMDNGGSGLSNCSAAVDRTLFQRNTGAGLADCNGQIRDSSIVGTINGPGILRGSVSVVRCLITANSSEGIFSSSGSVDQSAIVGNLSHGFDGTQGNGSLVRNSVISGNRGSGFFRSSIAVFNSTVVGNRDYGFANHSGEVRHCILWGNGLGPLANSTTPVFSGTSNPYFLRDGGWDNVNQEWLNGDYHLTPESPYIDAGDPNYPSSSIATMDDIEGNPRVVGSRVDIGAYEFQAECSGADFDDDGQADVCDRDVDGDGIGNFADVCEFTPTGTPVGPDGRPLADLNLDCIVGLADYAVFQNSFEAP